MSGSTAPTRPAVLGHGQPRPDPQPLDDLLRLAASLEMGWATASLLVGKLQSFRRQNALMRALQEHGRVIRSIHLVRCLDNPDYRNKSGESLHDLQRVFFSSPTRARSAARHESQTVQALWLNLATNAVIT